MAGRVVLAALLGGLVAFAWGAVSHMVLPLGNVGVKTQMPNESEVLPKIGEIRERGLYLFPGMNEKLTDPAAKKAEEQRWMAAYKHNPSGILVVRPPKGPFNFVSPLLAELSTSVLGALVIAIVVAIAAPATFGARVLIAALMGLFAGVAVLSSFCIWYGFPASYTMASTLDEAIGWGLAGLVIGKLVRPPAA